jgi:ferredoxin
LTSLSLRSRKNRIGAGLTWPKQLANVYPAMAMFVFLTWFELGFELTKSPLRTGVMALGFVVLALCTTLFFERRTFCRYLCLVGRVQGMYSLFAPVEVRARDFDVCKSCTGKECYNGSDEDVGCPTFLFPGALKESTYCTLCTECVRSCPEDNMTVNLRPFAADLGPQKRFRTDEAIFAVVLLALTSFHGLTMTPVWLELVQHLELALGLGKQAIFSGLMVLMIAWPIVLFYLAAKLARWLSGDETMSPAKIFKTFGYSVLPIALFYHLAHNGMHFFMEAQHLLPVLSDPLGRGWDLFGAAGKAYPPLLTLRTIWWLQLFLIIVGHVWSVIVSDRIALTVFKDRRAGLRALVPLIVTMILYSSYSIWLIAQPMEMRSGM